ncbi:MAG: hypothetical protein NTX28_07840 [Novosphingobium sp.]|nr:hypothetical protein [Novosphingobium sp.]
MKRYHADKIAEHPEGCLVLFPDAQTEIARLAALLREGGEIVQESIAEVHTLNGEIAQRDARIADLEMFKQQWAVADAALVSARQRISELEAELADKK